MFAVKRDRLQQAQRSLGILDRVEGESRLVLRESMPVGVQCILLLYVARIAQQHFAQCGRCLRADDRTREPLLYQQRQRARVIEVGMSKDDGRDAGRVDREVRPIHLPESPGALKEAAID
jgi:hypothetical protein